jgi:LemA protein
VAVGVGAALLIYSSYTSLVDSDRKMAAAYRQYDAELKPQRDLVPDLVEIVREVTLANYPEYSELQSITERVGRVRKLNEGVTVQNRFSIYLDKVISVADSYPQLRAGQDYAMVLERFQSAESRAIVERRRYNEAATEFNDKLKSFPGNLVSQVFDISDRPLLKTPVRLALSREPAYH